MKNKWLENSIKNLLPLSRNQTDFKTALTEWEWTGDCEDYEQCIEQCQLCEQDDLRYHYTIENRHTKQQLLIGSSCIEKFDITVRDANGNEITENKAAYLDKFMKQQRREKSMASLANAPANKMKEFQKGKRRYELDNYCAKRVANGMMDARMLNYLFIRFEEESIAFDARSFSIDIRSGEGKNKLLRLDKDQYERVKKALSVSQRTFYMNNKIEFDIKNGK